MSDTPRTDAAELFYREVCEDKNMPSYLVPADFARELELEVAELREALEMVKESATAMRGEDFNLNHEQWQKVNAALKGKP